ncbi:hypothetical protein [Taibaiella koreensis]|uniref:hypothetical protein n=1 Tax=Taibaiella koreensis TaxID=1268548 RepID=UPI000E59B1C4|nr:hypothetical protein [Taibaiella koreensis]
MRFLFIMLLNAAACYFALMIMPWWIPALIGFCITLLLPLRRNGMSFLAAGLGAALCYLLLCIITDQANEHILSRKMAVLFHLPSSWFMTAVTVLLGFITAGLGSWTAAALHRLFRNDKLKETAFAEDLSSS